MRTGSLLIPPVTSAWHEDAKWPMSFRNSHYEKPCSERSTVARRPLSSGLLFRPLISTFAHMGFVVAAMASACFSRRIVGMRGSGSRNNERLQRGFCSSMARYISIVVRGSGRTGFKYSLCLEGQRICKYAYNFSLVPPYKPHGMWYSHLCRRLP